MEVLVARPNRFTRQAAAPHLQVSAQVDRASADVSAIRAMFPSFPEDIVRDALTRCGGDAASTLNALLAGGAGAVETSLAVDTVTLPTPSTVIAAQATPMEPDVDESLELAMRLQHEEDEAERALLLAAQAQAASSQTVAQSIDASPLEKVADGLDKASGALGGDGRKLGAFDEASQEEGEEDEEVKEVEDPDDHIPPWQPMLRTTPSKSETDAARSYAGKGYYNLQTDRLKAALAATSTSPGGLGGRLDGVHPAESQGRVGGS